MSRQRGQIFRQASGLWAIRYRDAHGDRPQLTGFRTKAEAREVLEEALRQVRLGPLHRPKVTLRQLTEAFLEQHEAAPSTLVFLRENMRPALEAFGDLPIGALKVHQIGAWRASLPAGKRYRSHRALRQVLQAAVRWKWIEDNPATGVKNPTPKPGEIHPFESWDEIDARGRAGRGLGSAGDLPGGNGRAAGGGVRRRVVRRRPQAPGVQDPARVREGSAE